MCCSKQIEEKEGMEMSQLTEDREQYRKTCKECILAGRAKLKNGLFLDALSCYRNAVELNSKSMVARIELGSLLLKLGKVDEGLSTLNKTVSLFPNHSQPYVFLAAAYYWCGDHELAQENSRLALETDICQPQWINYMADVQTYNFMILEKYKIAYLPMPKCASTTMKKLFYYLQTGEETDMPHYFFPIKISSKVEPRQMSDYEGYFRCIIIRDPVKRFMSYFFKNIISERSLFGIYGSDRYPLSGLDCLLPNINCFIDRLEDYIYSFIDTRHHTLCQSAYIGNALADFDYVCPIEELEKMKLQLEELTETNIELPNLMRSSQSKSKSITPFYNISLHSLSKLINFYKDDYDILNEYYTSEALIEEYKEATFSCNI